MAIPEKEKIRAQEDGYISCSECGHRLIIHVDDEGDGRDYDGCADCMCDVSFTKEQFRLLCKAYGVPCEVPAS